MNKPALNLITTDAVPPVGGTRSGTRHLRSVPTDPQPAPRLVIDRFDQWGDLGRDAFTSCCVSYSSCVDLSDELEAAA